MAENKDSNIKNADVRPKSSRSRSADRKDGYVWSGKKLSWSKKSEHCSDAEAASTVGRSGTGLRSQERKYSCSSIELDLDRSCGHRFLGRSLKQKLQDAVGQCFPIKNCSSRHASGLPSKRKIHISELMLDKCPFPPRSELAFRWHLIKRHTAPISQKADEWIIADLSQNEEREDQLRDDEIASGGTDSPSPSCDLTDSSSSRGDSRAELVTSKVGRCSRDESDMDSDDEVITLCTSSRKRNKPKWETDDELLRMETPPKYHTQIDYVHCLVPDLLQINNNPCYWGVMDKYAAEALLEGKPEGTFLLRDSAQEDYLFSVSFRRYSRSLHARIEQWNHNFSFDAHDPCVFHSPDITGLLEHYKDPSSCMFFEPLLSTPLNRTFPFSLQHICRTVICNCTTYDGIDALPIPPSVKLYLKEYHYKSKVRVLRIDVPEQQS
ncbi:SOCS4 protein, partial [Dromaius novaehollandiae]|nr:suppressor of cytokine signaling 4 [Dromaius novaehollandiae]XP_025955829.1 suppressor of cytokine signaling 4 [Dromaius novaehollandiae]XP_025955830.1 suppressor of cytokine signaling 4 [Dromaius novaehollandiae]NXG36359.1 SOCS4 protein [Dromaius novaehollandiae]